MQKFFWPLLKVNLRIQGLVWRGTAYFVPPKNTTILLTWRHSTSYERVAMLDTGDPFLEPTWVRRLETKQMFHIFHTLQSEIPVSDTIVLQIRPLSQNYWFILICLRSSFILYSAWATSFELEWLSESYAYSAFFEFWQALDFILNVEGRRKMLVPRPTLVAWDSIRKILHSKFWSSLCIQHIVILLRRSS